MDKHFEGYCSLQYMARGAVELSYDDENHALSGKWFWPAFPGPTIRFHAAAGKAHWDHRYVAFQGPLMNRWRADGLFLKAPQEAPAGEKWAEMFDVLLNEARRGGRWGTLRAINQLERILLMLAEQRHETGVDVPWLSELLDQLNQCDTFTTNYDSFASRAGMSLSTLRRQFKRLTGVALHTYAMQCRSAKAREMLGDSSLSIKQIAASLGYGDVYFFSKQFKKAIGTPPAEYRRSRQG